MKAKIVMIGNCSKCSREHRRSYPIDAAACPCTMRSENPCGNANDATLVPLSPTLFLPNAVFQKFEMISQICGVEVEALVNKALELAAKSMWTRFMETCP